VWYWGDEYVLSESPPNGGGVVVEHVQTNHTSRHDKLYRRHNLRRVSILWAIWLMAVYNTLHSPLKKRYTGILLFANCYLFVSYLLWDVAMMLIHHALFRTDLLLHPCGKQHFREIATPDWVGQFTYLTHS